MVDSASRQLLARMKPERTTCSWAIWDDDDIGFPEEPNGLHNRTIFMAGNPGNAAADPGRKPWMNFHTGKRHGDHRIAPALRGTGAWGGFMCDFLSQVDSKLTNVDRGSKPVAAGVTSLVRRVNLLQADNPTLLLCGDALILRKAQNLNAYAAELGIEPTDVVWHHLPHYSGANGRRHHGNADFYRELVAWSLSHPRVLRPWSLPAAPAWNPEKYVSSPTTGDR